MQSKNLSGFGGVVLKADTFGTQNDPHVVLIPSFCGTRQSWEDIPLALAKAGRYVINLDLRGHGESDRPGPQRYELDDYVEDLRSVLAQLSSRPTIIASTFGGWIAATALAESKTQLACGLVLIDTPIDPDEEALKNIYNDLRQQGQSSKYSDWDPNILTFKSRQNSAKRFRDSIEKISEPVLYIHNHESIVTSLQDCGDLADFSPAAEIQEIGGADALEQFEESEALSAVLIDYLERKVPRATPEYVDGSDSRTLRDAMGCFATGITVITTMTSEEIPIGFTANAFTSVSLEPPLLAVCIAKSGGSLPYFEEANHFGVNILHIGQQAISNLFASSVDDRFSKVRWHSSDNDIPLIDNSAASIECVKHTVHDGGDHVILIGKVVKAQFDKRRDPLLYHSGQYRRLHFA